MDPKFFRFEGDQHLSYEYIWRTGYKWLAVAEHARNIAGRYGVPLSAPTLERWIRLWALIPRLDMLLDDPPSGLSASARKIYGRLMDVAPSELGQFPEWVPADLPEVAALFWSSAEELGRDRCHRIMSLGWAAAECAERKADQRWVWPYARLLIREGCLVTSLVMECMTEVEQSAKGYKQFVRAFRCLAVAGMFADSAMDLARDCEAGLVRVPSNLVNKSILLAGMTMMVLGRPRLFLKMLPMLCRTLNMARMEQERILAPAKG